MGYDVRFSFFFKWEEEFNKRVGGRELEGFYEI